MDINIFETWTHMNPLVRGVVVLLSLQALASLAVVVDRLIVLWTGYRASKRFAQPVSPLLASCDFEGVLHLGKQKAHQNSQLGSLITVGVKTFTRRIAEGHSKEKSVELARRALDRKGENLSEQLHRGLNILASTGSTAPFIGLLGTVLGILNAFRLLGQEGSQGIGTIGGAIAEALIVTGFGLMVAIPSVLIFNALSTRIAKYEALLGNASSELVDQLETSSVSSDNEQKTKRATNVSEHPLHSDIKEILSSTTNEPNAPVVSQPAVSA